MTILAVIHWSTLQAKHTRSSFVSIALLTFTVQHVLSSLVFHFLCVLADVFLFFFTSPSCQLNWHFPEEERDFLLVQEVVRVARSLRAQCGMTKEKPTSESSSMKEPVKKK